MNRNCPFCGQKIKNDAQQCNHCGKVLRKKKTETSEQAGLTNLDTWKSRSVPAWVLYLAVALSIFIFAIMLTRSWRSDPPAEPTPTNDSTEQNADQ